MGKKPSDPRKKSGPVRDWHLWSAVGRTVTPLPFRKSADPKAAIEELEKALNPEPERKLDLRPRIANPTMPAYRPILKAAQQRAENTLEPGLKKRLERGRVPIDATLDLHGMTQAQAQAALARFIPSRAARGDRTILVITGKGLKKTGYLQIENKGVLRAMVPIWLSDPALSPMIAGIDVAHQSHGGQGALYVRLKRARP
jgi:DNA-nicking Smr family endonuclease